MKKQPNRAIHEVLRQFPYGLYAVGIADQTGAKANALVVSWLTQCSFEPPLVLIAVRRDSTSFRLLQQGRVFTVNLIDLPDQQLMHELVKPAHTSGKKLDAVGHVRGRTGAPILSEAFAYAECKVRDIVETGDHAVVIGEVVHAEQRREGSPVESGDLGWRYGG